MNFDDDKNNVKPSDGRPFPPPSRSPSPRRRSRSRSPLRSRSRSRSRPRARSNGRSRSRSRTRGVRSRSRSRSRRRSKSSSHSRSRRLDRSGRDRDRDGHSHLPPPAYTHRRRSRTRSRSRSFGGRPSRKRSPSPNPPYRRGNDRMGGRRMGIRSRSPLHMRRSRSPSPSHRRKGRRFRSRSRSFDRGNFGPPHHPHGMNGDFRRNGGGPPPMPFNDRGPAYAPHSFNNDRGPPPNISRNPRGRRDDTPAGVSLLVRNLSCDITCNDLQSAFRRIGEVKDVYIPLDYHSKQPKGFAFIEYATHDQARNARDEMNRFLMKGRELEVVFAQEKRKTPGEMRVRTDSPEREGGHDGNGPGSADGCERSSSFERHRRREEDRRRGSDDRSGSRDYGNGK